MAAAQKAVAAGNPSAPATRGRNSGTNKSVMDLRKGSEAAFKKAEIMTGNWMPPDGDYTCVTGTFTEEVRTSKQDNTSYWAGTLELQIIDHPDQALEGRIFKKFYNNLQKKKKDGTAFWPGLGDLKSDFAVIFGRESAEEVSMNDCVDAFLSEENQGCAVSVKVETGEKNDKGKAYTNARIVGLANRVEDPSTEEAAPDEQQEVGEEDLASEDQQ